MSIKFHGAQGVAFTKNLILERNLLLKQKAQEIAEQIAKRELRSMGLSERDFYRSEIVAAQTIKIFYINSHYEIKSFETHRVSLEEAIDLQEYLNLKEIPSCVIS